MLNAAVQRMVSAALWLSPLGVGSLVAASILRACDLLGGRVFKGDGLVGVSLPQGLRAWLRVAVGLCVAAINLHPGWGWCAVAWTSQAP